MPLTAAATTRVLAEGLAHSPGASTGGMQRGNALRAADMLVAQIGARMHYAVPRILADAGVLDRLCTDLCAIKGWPSALRLVPPQMRPRAVDRLLGRVPKDLDPDQVTAFTGFGLSFARRQARARSPSEVLAAHLWAGKTFSQLARDVGLRANTGSVYCFNSAGLELMQEAANRGLGTVIEQTIAPREIGVRLLGEEHAAFAGWEAPLPNPDLVAELAEREQAEWNTADLVVCGSEFVQDGIAACGGPADRCSVVPYGVDETFWHPQKVVSGRSLRVLTVGEVGLRKGAPYVAQAAKKAGSHVRFRMVGGSSLSPRARAAVAAHVELIGPVPRSLIHAQYGWADVFLLPSLYEGSATVVYEALAAGLPVICTPNTGSIVRDGVDGFVVPIRDSDAILERLSLLSDPVLRAEMSANARERAQEGRLAAYRNRLLLALNLTADP